MNPTEDDGMAMELFPTNLFEIDTSTFHPEKFQLIDIREDTELQTEPLLNFKSLHMPLSAFKEKSLDPKATYLFFCHRGKRSLNLVTYLRNKGWENVYSLSGGILALNRK